jgi:hypothetical protein
MVLEEMLTYFIKMVAWGKTLICGVLEGSQDGISMWNQTPIIKCMMYLGMQHLHITPSPLLWFSTKQMVQVVMAMLLKTMVELASSTNTPMLSMSKNIFAAAKNTLFQPLKWIIDSSKDTSVKILTQTGLRFTRGNWT